jgi:hypothetical protein
MGDSVLNSFLKAKGLISDPKPETKAKVLQKNENLNIKINNYPSISQIIEEKPSRKKLIGYLKTKMECNEKELLD